MVNTPSWLKPLGTVVAVLIVALLLAGAVAVPARSARAPEGYEQPRIHFNTKNSTRFNGASLAETAALNNSVQALAATGFFLPDFDVGLALFSADGELLAASNDEAWWHSPGLQQQLVALFIIWSMRLP